MKSLLLAGALCCAFASANAQTAQKPPSPQEIQAQAMIQLGQLEQAFGQAIIGYEKQLADADQAQDELQDAENK
jgi:hypothetical protein